MPGTDKSGPDTTPTGGWNSLREQAKRLGVEKIFEAAEKNRMENPAPIATIDNESIIQELKDEHGITAVVLRCPCACDANSLTGHPKPDCPYCSGEGKVQYGIDEVEFL